MITSDLAAELFNDSLERCTASPEFLDRFYDLFLASSREVAEKFRHADFPKQKRMLQASLYMMILATDGKAEIHRDLQRIAKRHSRTDLDIRPELYTLWLECLIQAVRECDPQFTPETEAAWRRIMEQGIKFMQSYY
jgi:hemoglobin-like flavoprotein